MGENRDNVIYFGEANKWHKGKIFISFCNFSSVKSKSELSVENIQKIHLNFRVPFIPLDISQVIKYVHKKPYYDQVNNTTYLSIIIKLFIMGFLPRSTKAKSELVST